GVLDQNLATLAADARMLARELRVAAKGSRPLLRAPKLQVPVELDLLALRRPAQNVQCPPRHRGSRLHAWWKREPRHYRPDRAPSSTHASANRARTRSPDRRFPSDGPCPAR